MTRECFPVGNINIVTNGVLVLKMDNKFWDTIKRYDVVLAPTRYPINVDYDKIKQVALDKGVKFQYYGDAKEIWYHSVITEEGNRNELHSFLECGNANNCTVLKHGKLYPCPRVAKIDIFNNFFNTNFQITSRDYIDIYSDIDLNDIMEFLSKPIPLCRYCNPFAMSQIEWNNSERLITEWT